MQPVVYMMSNQNNKVLYIGVTSNLVQRVYQHRNHLIDGFTKKYNVTKLVYFEIHEDMSEAIKREKVLKNWHRDWKNRLVSEVNPDWIDLWYSVVGDAGLSLA